MLRSLLAFVFLICLSIPLRAQEVAWVQVEAQPTLTEAQARARAYAAEFGNVVGYDLGGGWYGIALGPYGKADAEALLADLRRQGRVPGDSFIADGSRFKTQFWPVGIGAPTTAQPLSTATEPSAAPDALSDTQSETATEPEAAPAPPVIAQPDETEREARASESLLTRPERELLQTAMKWAGFYDASIDGAFGRGTRASMAAWQEANNHEVTGILTTGQRAELIAQYNAPLEGTGMALVRDDAAGIEMQLPTALVAFAKYDPPFAHYEAKTDLPAQVFLISQEGDQTRFAGLYEILQTLEVIPTEGPRARSNDSFEIEGQNAEIHSYTYARLESGAIKGFTLVWPAGDEERRSRVLDLMKASFTTIDGALDPAAATPGAEQGVDLVSGLAVRQPKLSRSGFYIDGKGDVLTTLAAVEGCDYLTIDDDHRASVLHRDEALGLAVLRPDTALAPLQSVAFQTAIPRLQSDVAVGGYPYGGVLSRPSLTFGKLADIRGLNGEGELKRLALVAQEGDAGGPVFDNGGAVLGMLAPKVPVNGQVLPPEVSFAVDAGQIIASLTAAGLSVETTESMAFMPPEALTVLSGDVTVLVSCW